MISKLKLSTLLLFILSSNLFNAQVTSETLDYASGGQDSFTRNFYPSTPTNSTVISTLVNGTPSSPNIRRIYIEFDLSSIPENAIIVSGEISLYRYRDDTYPSTVINRISESWDETTLTWNNAPSVHVSDEITTTPTYTGGRHYFDVTDQLQEMVNYQHLNYGWRLRSEDETVSSYTCGKFQTCYTTEGTGYRSFNYSYTSYRPELEIEYVLPIEITLNQITHPDTPSSSNGSISVNVSEGNGSYSYQWIDGSTGNDISGETSSFISNLSPGWYGVEVTDGLGNVSYMAFVVGAKCGIVQIKFQPDSRFVADTYIAEGHPAFSGTDYPNTNYGTSTTLFSENTYVSNWLGTSDYTREYLLKNLLIIPNNIELLKADQKLFGYSHVYSNGNESSVRLITEQWDENVVTWNTEPTSYIFDTIPSTSSSNENVTLNHKSLYSLYQDGTYTNHGYNVQLNYNPLGTTNREMSFYTSDYGTASKRPKLTVILGTPCSAVKLSRKLDGNFYTTVNQQLFVEYNEPYEIDSPSDIEYKILNQSGIDVSNGSALQNISLNREVNILTFDFSGNGNCLSTGYYTLEVYGPKGDKRVLRFYHENTGC